MNIIRKPSHLFTASVAKTGIVLFLFALLPSVSGAQCPDNRHPHQIDLGLPSGTKWACCNVGADKPEGNGGYYAWGETEEKTEYFWSTYLHGTYNDDGDYSLLEYLGADIAGTQYDVAHQQWGGNWVMPSYDQMAELCKNCESEWNNQNGVDGYLFTATNGATLFFPASGYRGYNGVYLVGKEGDYWLSFYDESSPLYGGTLHFDNDDAFFGCAYYRFLGLQVRAVNVSAPSGIEAIDNSAVPPSDAAPMYNLNGQRMEGLPKTKGIFIRGGKKVLMK
ncbi:MAG: hypothetical protein J5506_02210 [Prevotella sp.]|nr:hypothetical protein [Prevotella sp.]